MIITVALIVLVLLLCSAFFSSSETALTAASRPRMYRLEQQGNKKAGLVNRLRQDTDQLITTLLLGNNLVNILASALATNLFVQIFGSAGVIYATIVMTVLVLIIAEVIPKTYAIYHAEKIALIFAPMIHLISVLLGPITKILRKISHFCMKTVGGVPSDHHLHVSLEELLGAIDLHGVKGEDEQQERQMLRSILDLDDVTVDEIMTHRKNVTLLDANLGIDVLVDEVIKSPYSRIPVWRKNPDNIIGVLNSKLVLREVREHALQGKDLKDLKVEDITVDPWFISESTSLLDQLQAFQKRNAHFAVVVDEYGTFMGIVTLEDILEEIVGDIKDESDISVLGIKVKKDGFVTVDGDVTIRDLNREFDWGLPDEEAATIAGLMIHEAREIPEVGKEFSFHGFRFEVLRRRKNQITSVKIIPAKS